MGSGWLERTYQYCWVIRRLRLRLWLFLWLFIHLNVLHITATEDDILESLLRGRDIICDLTVFCAERKYIFQRDGRFFRVDLVEGPDVSD